MADLTRILRDLNRHKTLFDLTRNGLGEKLLDIAAKGIKDIIDAEATPEGIPWIPLRQKYAERKSRERPGAPMGVYDFIMARPEEIAGQTTVSSDMAEMKYGKSEIAKSHATSFQTGDRARPFWGFSQDMIGDSDELLDRRLQTA